MLEQIATGFAPARGRTYLDVATYGLPPNETVRAMRAAIAAWQRGTARWIEDFDSAAEAPRASFAALIGADVADVSTQPTVSVGIATIATSLKKGDEVLVPSDEFTSVLYPLLGSEQRGVRVRQAPLGGLPDAIHAGTKLVATSLVQMQTGRAAPLGAIIEAARPHGTRILLDVTQAVPLAPQLNRHIHDIDYLVCAGYKHLLCPRGTAFLVVRKDRWDDLDPIHANWRAGDPPYGSYFGGPVRLGPGAFRFDVSHAWFSWIGARESLRLLVEWQAAGAMDEVRALAQGLSEGLGVPWEGTTLVCVPITNDTAAAAALRKARVRVSTRGTSLRISPHVYNSQADIDRAIQVIRPFVAGRSA